MRILDIGPFVNVDNAPLLIEIPLATDGRFFWGQGFGVYGPQGGAIYGPFPSVGAATDHAIEFFSA